MYNKSYKTIAIFKEKVNKKDLIRIFKISLIAFLAISIIWISAELPKLIASDFKNLFEKIWLPIISYSATVLIIYIFDRKPSSAKIIFYEEGIIILGSNEEISLLKQLDHNPKIYIPWKDIIEITISKDIMNGKNLFFNTKENFTATINLSNIKAKYIYPKEIYPGESLLDGIDHDTLNLLYICLRRAHNTKWTGNILPSDIFGKAWKNIAKS